MDARGRAEQICTGISFLSRADRNNALWAIARALDKEDAKLAKLHRIVDQWCDLQLAHPGATPGVDALKRVIERYRPKTKEDV